MCSFIACLCLELFKNLSYNSIMGLIFVGLTRSLTKDKSELLPAVSEKLLERLDEFVTNNEQCEKRLDTSKIVFKDHKKRQ